jgi:uncharacterized protein YjaG (DUF416 family)
MTHRFEPAALERRLGALSPQGRIAFGVLLLERALPNFLQFSIETGAPGGAVLRGALARLWDVLEGEAGRGGRFPEVTATTCESIGPDTEDFSSLYTSAALDAVGIACNVLAYWESQEIGLLVESASLRRDTIDMFLQNTLNINTSSPDFEERLLTHPLMQEELGFQQADLACLTRSGPHESLWQSVLQKSLEQGYGSLRMTVDAARNAVSDGRAPQADD